MKRKRKTVAAQNPNKRLTSNCCNDAHPSLPLLRQYYPQVITLREYLISALPKSSKKRRRKIQRYGKPHGGDPSVDDNLAHVLDTAIVGRSKVVEDGDVSESTIDDLTVFTQQLSDSVGTVASSTGALQQAEIVDFTIWTLFRKNCALPRPQHILCRGYSRSAAGVYAGLDPVLAPGIPGILVQGQNQYAKALKGDPWTELPALIGKGADSVISNLLIYHGLFVPVPNSSNLNQISGVPLHELKTATAPAASTTEMATLDPQNEKANSCSYKFSNIRFLRYRMMYAKPTLNSRGSVSYGLPYAHVLSRLQNPTNQTETVHFLKYLFPKQFGLHNVLTSTVDPKESGQPCKDYTFREQEITRVAFRKRVRHAGSPFEDAKRNRKVPKRLRGQAFELATSLRKRHSKCSYRALLEHYCPMPSSPSNDEANCLSMATSATQVSAFCRAVVSKVFPKQLWGDGDYGVSNQRQVLEQVDNFVRYRRYETTSLHAVMQDIKISSIGWCAANDPKGNSLSKTDTYKHQELLAELLYYLFDSFLVPLIRGHFHVTESNVHRNQLFYFRHDVWKKLSEPTLASLKAHMLEECESNDVLKDCSKRQLGFSNVRLLPKERGLRPIINLRRRVQKLQNGKLVLGRSINSALTPAFAILNYEKNRRPDALGSALFSVDDMHPRLLAFRAGLQIQGLESAPLYFAKVDVKSCFDTIPQKRLMQLARTILQADSYRISRHARARLLGGHGHNTSNSFGGKPSWKFVTRAIAADDDRDFAAELEAEAQDGRARTTYVDGVLQKREKRSDTLKLLEEHIEANIIKIGKRFYRQKEGIPQGSIVSSLLCSYFYAEMERQELEFLEDGKTLMLRLIDDFLVVSLEKGVAERFMRVMHRGLEEFGVKVKGEKSRVNFDCVVDGVVVQRTPAVVDFPYCGSAINTRTLDITKDEERRKKMDLSNASTVEYSKLPGQTFYRKTLNATKLQMHAMLLSTTYNSQSTVLRNLQHSFNEVAQKSYYYIRSLPPSKQPAGKLVMRAVDDLIKLACVLMKRKAAGRGGLKYECSVTKAQTRWIACRGFLNVFGRRQTKHGLLLVWLRGQLEEPPLRAVAIEMGKVLK